MASRAARLREPTADELQKAWGSRNTLGVHSALEKVDRLLNVYEETDTEVSSPEVSPDKKFRQNRSGLRRNKKEFADWSAASIFSDSDPERLQSGKETRSVQSPFKKFEPSPIPSFKGKEKSARGS